MSDTKSVMLSADGSPYKIQVRRSGKHVAFYIASEENFYVSNDFSKSLSEEHLSKNICLVAVGESNSRALIAGLRSACDHLEEMEEELEQDEVKKFIDPEDPAEIYEEDDEDDEEEEDV